MYAGAGGVFPRTFWHYAGWYEPLCAAGAFRYITTEPGQKSWTPRQIKAIDEAVAALPGGGGGPPADGVSRWCGCLVTSGNTCK